MASTRVSRQQGRERRTRTRRQVAVACSRPRDRPSRIDRASRTREGHVLCGSLRRCPQTQMPRTPKTGRETHPTPAAPPRRGAMATRGERSELRHCRQFDEMHSAGDPCRQNHERERNRTHCLAIGGRTSTDGRHHHEHERRGDQCTCSRVSCAAAFAVLRHCTRSRRARNAGRNSHRPPHARFPRPAS